MNNLLVKALVNVILRLFKAFHGEARELHRFQKGKDRAPSHLLPFMAFQVTLQGKSNVKAV